MRDGAAAQYGSDAIAGILNFVLKEALKELDLKLRSGEYKEGDGESWRVAANVGMPFSSNGYANLSLELQDSEATS